MSKQLLSSPLGERLKLARAKAGLSLRDLSEKLVNNRVTPQAIGKYERGLMTPGSQVLLELCSVLNVRLAHLMNAENASLGNVEFRAQASTTARERSQVESQIQDWLGRYLELERILELDSSLWNEPFRPERVSCLQDAESLANSLRDKWNLGIEPIQSITEVLEEHGLKIMCTELPLRVSGLTCTVSQGGKTMVPVIVVNSQFSLERRRLTLAHELAHRLICSTTDIKATEKLANRFAAAFLMPSSVVKLRLGSKRHSVAYDEIIHSKRYFRVSAVALLYRLKDLEVISEETFTYKMKTMAKFWRTSEPQPLCDDNEIPRRFHLLCSRAYSEGLIGRAKAAELIQEDQNTVLARLRGPEL